MVAGQDR
jgi:hypothetical protein